jgi:hypothetical protein
MINYSFESFWIWVKEKVNPVRLVDGLKEISQHEAEKAYAIMKNFDDDFMKGSNHET